MIFWPDEKEIKKKWYQHEIDELKTYAQEQGFAEQQTTTFVKNSIINLLKSDYQGVAADDKEAEELAETAFKSLGLEL